MILEEVARLEPLVAQLLTGMMASLVYKGKQLFKSNTDMNCTW